MKNKNKFLDKLPIPAYGDTPLSEDLKTDNNKLLTHLHIHFRTIVGNKNYIMYVGLFGP